MPSERTIARLPDKGDGPCGPFRLPTSTRACFQAACFLFAHWRPIFHPTTNRYSGSKVNFSNYKKDEIKKSSQLRAVVWVAAFLSQPLAPIMFIFFPSYWVIAAISMLGILWSLIWCFCVNMTIATIACFVIVWAKWAPAIGSVIYSPGGIRKDGCADSFTEEVR